MQQIVEVVLNIQPTDGATPDQILDQIAQHIRAKRNIALDRVAFEECRQGANESFDEFYVRLRRLADSAEICPTSSDVAMATHIMVGVRDANIKQKLLARSPFPSAQEARTLCLSEEAAHASERLLSGHQSSINALQASTAHQNGTPFKGARCTSCGGSRPHTDSDPCMALGKKCHWCSAPGHITHPRPGVTLQSHPANLITVDQATRMPTNPKLGAYQLEMSRLSPVEFPQSLSSYVWIRKVRP